MKFGIVGIKALRKFSYKNFERKVIKFQNILLETYKLLLTGFLGFIFTTIFRFIRSLPHDELLLQLLLVLVKR